MPLRSSLTKLFGKSLSRWSGAAIVLGLFAASAGGCGGCEDTSLVCDASGTNCRICDGYGCHPADPNVTSSVGGGNGGVGGNATTTSSSEAGGAPVCDVIDAACPCAANEDCSGTLACVNGVCVPGCNYSYECGPEHVCINGGCALGCDAHTPCPSGYSCNKGACVLDPSKPQCGTGAPCPSGQECVEGLCTNSCNTNADCAPGSICDGGTHVCVTDPSPKPACSDTVKCTGVNQVCLPDGYCHYPCDTVSTCKKIDSRFVACEQGVCKTTEESMPECTLTKPCPEGKDCVSNRCL